MKKLFFLAFLLAFSANSQTQFDYLGGLELNPNSTGCFYIDLNTGNTNTGENDVKFVHGNGEIYFDAVYGDSLIMPAPQRSLNGKRIWNECNKSTNVYLYSKAYILTDFNRLSEGSHVLPFKWGNLYNYIVLKVENGRFFIRGWVFNIPEPLFECYQLTTFTN